MNIATVNESIYLGSGWAIAAVVDRNVIAASYIEHPDTIDLKAAVEAFKSNPVVIAAEKAAQDAWDALQAAEAADSDEDEIERLDRDFSATAIRIRGGMMSSTEFCYEFSRKERAKAGVKNEWI